MPNRDTDYGLRVLGRESMRQDLRAYHFVGFLLMLLNLLGRRFISSHLSKATCVVFHNRYTCPVAYRKEIHSDEIWIACVLVADRRQKLMFAKTGLNCV